MTNVITKQVNLRGAARAVLKCRDPEVLLAGPAGTGKSYAALWKVHLVLLANPGARALAVRKVGRSLSATGLVTYREHVAKEALENGLVHWFGGSQREAAAFRYSNGSVLTVGGLDDPDKIMSSEHDICYIQEATDCTLEDWEKVSSRLRNGRVSFQQLLADCNPQQPSHWLKKRADAGTTTMLYSTHEDNPRLFDEGGEVTEFGGVYLSRLDALTGARYLRLRKGLWAAAEGLVYESWDPSRHLVNLKDHASSVTGRLPLKWERVWSVDFGYTNPFVWQQWAIDPDGRMWLEEEIYRTKTLVEDHAKAILDRVSARTQSGNGGVGRRTWWYPKPSRVICDHDAEDRATLEKHLGFSTRPATKTVKDGIEAVELRLRMQGDGRPRLMLLRDANKDVDTSLGERGLPASTAEEFEGYVWEMPADGKLDKDRPLKLNDHGMDAARYAVADQDLKGRVNIRWL